jgi:multidrug transporter EmrE-like cation transporter
MSGITPGLVSNLVGMVFLQLVGVALLPRTQGFTQLGPTIAVLTVFALSYWILARIVHSGASLGILIPLLATIMPLATVAIGVVMYGESASVVKIGLLATACTLIGIASRF